MNSIYEKYAYVYEIMYQHFIDYRAEYEIYTSLLDLKKGSKILELCCGTGNMANHFRQDGFHYIGLDLNEGMLEIARKKSPFVDFELGDMRNFRLDEKVNGVMIMARSVSYMSSNQDFINMLIAVNRNLTMGGSIAFDIIDSNEFIPPMKDGISVWHKVQKENIMYSRESKWSIESDQSWNFRWISDYYIQEEGKLQQFLVQDDSIVRSFTRNDIEIFFKLTGFKLTFCEPRETYAFPTLVFKAVKVS